MKIKNTLVTAIILLAAGFISIQAQNNPGATGPVMTQGQRDSFRKVMEEEVSNVGLILIVTGKII